MFLSSLLPQSIKDALKEEFELCLLPPFEKLPVPVATHPDMLIFKSKEKLIVHGEYLSENRGLFENFRDIIRPSEEQILPSYPNDVLLNALLMGDTLFARRDSISKIILARHPYLVNVKQGYSACSCCKLSQHALISADRGIAARAQELGLSVLLISPGSIALDGYDYGFIGGASFIWKDRVYFFGNPESHPDWKSIHQFINKHNRQITVLDPSLPLTDFGGGVVIEKYVTLHK